MHTPYKEHSFKGGKQRLYRFTNNYGASLVRHLTSYGLEMAVIVFAPDSYRFEITYDTPITDNVLGELDEAEVQPLLDRIAALPAYVYEPS